jgi:dUTPase
MANPIYKFALREDLANEKQFLPTRAEPKSSGWDVRAAMSDKQPLVLRPFGHAKIPLGFRVFCPEGWWLELRPRSSTFGKNYLHSLYGVIDETYEGELLFACQYIPNLSLLHIQVSPQQNADDKKWLSGFDTSAFAELTINYGDAIGQLVPVKRNTMKVVEITNKQYDKTCKGRKGKRGKGGFGSTGK